MPPALRMLRLNVKPIVSSPTSGVRHARATRCQRKPGSSGTASITAKRARDTAWKRPTRRRLRTILERLRDAYGRPVPRVHRAPVDELILTVLSQNTNDRNRDVAYTRLRERFASWDDVRDAPVDQVEDAIRPGGLAPTQAVRIQEILRSIGDDDLSWLEHAPLGEARGYLQQLPGVGRKTAACVLLFSYGRPDIPV